MRLFTVFHFSILEIDVSVLFAVLVSVHEASLQEQKMRGELRKQNVAASSLASVSHPARIRKRLRERAGYAVNGEEPTVSCFKSKLSAHAQNRRISVSHNDLI